MSPWNWTECPKGCKGDGGQTDTVRVDIDWHFTEASAYVMFHFECLICGLKCKLEREKKPKHIIKELSYD